MRSTSRFLIIAALAAVILFPIRASALDPLETFDTGSVSLELGAGLHGFSGGRHFEGLDFKAALVYGFCDRFTGYAAGEIGSDADFDSPRGSAAFGLIGNPLDTEHVDLFLSVEFSFGDYGAALTPGFEFQFNVFPDSKKLGFYLHVDEVLVGDPGSASPSFHPFTELAAGLYWTVLEGHVLLAQFDSVVNNNPVPGQRVVDIGAVALGYNVEIANGIELLADVHCDLPQTGEDVAFGFSVGFKFEGINRR